MRVFTAAFIVLAAASTVLAAPIQVGIGAFSASATVIDFNAIADEFPITTQFAAQGVTFSGGIYGMTNSGDIAFFPASGGVIASNWLYSGSAHGPMPITLTFAAPVFRLGFLTEVNAGDTTTISTFSNATPTGSVSLLSGGLGAVFFGVEDLAGFNSITIDVTGGENHFIGLDDLRFESGAITEVPEPATLLSLAAGLALFALGRRARPSR